MPVEVIGEFGTAGAEREWIAAQCELATRADYEAAFGIAPTEAAHAGKGLAIEHLKKVCGEPPPEMELEIQWQEHELGEYPTIVLSWEDAMRGAPWEYIARCEKALTAYENGEEPPTWSRP